MAMAGEATRHVQLYGAQLADPAKYRTYREHMTPILHRHGGRFTHDFTIGTVLASELAHPIDRLFLISFPDRRAAERFFADPSYLEVRRTWFEPAVTAISLIASFDQPALPSRPTS
jgi:uncharacterized protein (DUF1330 family)